MKTFALAVAAALLIGVASPQAQAQHPEAANASTFGIAVVDISFVFKNHDQFKARMEQMKNEMKGIEDGLKAKRDGIARMEEARNNLKPGTPDYKLKDDELAQAKAGFNLEMNRLQKDLMEKESKIYYSTYRQISDTIANYAKQRRIGLVLRFSGDLPDPSNPKDILKDINRPVVFENNVDITRDIVTLVNSGQIPRSNATANPNLPGRPGGALPPK
ncbi:OmpH family outer membrane protein [Aeoliella sp.]|uniref:OmpH family outer membrane protein n=1 Tax=Aeoliella sp. TaxID=2795800 RepID=UPI003CCBC08E